MVKLSKNMKIWKLFIIWRLHIQWWGFSIPQPNSLIFLSKYLHETLIQLYQDKFLKFWHFTWLLGGCKQGNESHTRPLGWLLIGCLSWKNLEMLWKKIFKKILKNLEISHHTITLLKICHFQKTNSINYLNVKCSDYNAFKN